MKIHDISQNIFEAKIYPGDPAPTKTILNSIKDGDSYNLSSFSMCTHTGTHVDAPSHFIQNGKTIDQMPLNKFVGYCYVVEVAENINKEVVNKIFSKINDTDISKILIKGKGVLTIDSAQAIKDMNIDLIGTEHLSFGTSSDEKAIHKILLEAEIILLEGLNLNNINDGKYFLNAAPLNLKGLEGAPCRAILIESDKFLKS